jgi:hypothetical protein
MAKSTRTLLERFCHVARGGLVIEEQPAALIDQDNAVHGRTPAVDALDPARSRAAATLPHDEGATAEPPPRAGLPVYRYCRLPVGVWRGAQLGAA